MKWFRSKIKYGSRLALFALAVQFVFSFGHFHGVHRAGPQPPSYPSLPNRRLWTPTACPPPTPLIGPAQPQPASNHDPDQQPKRYLRDMRRHGDGETICCSRRHHCCLLPQASKFLYQTTDAEFVHPELGPRRLSAPRSPDLLISIDERPDDRFRHAQRSAGSLESARRVTTGRHYPNSPTRGFRRQLYQDRKHDA